jgi:hypothetical protein
MRQRPSRTPFTCPVCGETLSAEAKSCPSCGACDRSGWSRDANYDGLDLPEWDAVGASDPQPPRDSWMLRYAWAVALLLLIAMASVLFRS